MMQLKPEIELITSSGKISMKKLSHFNAGLKVRNRSDEELSFDVSETTLWVNGQRCYAWDLAVQNGTIVNLKVSPHQEKLVDWPIGKSLFESPGKYNLELHWKEFTKSCDVLVSG
jgi:hypothetical protein